MAESNLVKTLIKSLKVLDCFTKGEKELGNPDIAHALGIFRHGLAAIMFYYN